MRKGVLCLFCCWSMAVFPQSDKFDKKQKNRFLDGDSYYVYGDYLTAIEFLEPLFGVDPDFRELNFKLGDSYFQLDNYTDSKSYLKQSVSYSSDAYFLLAKICLHDEQLDSAKIYLDNYYGRLNSIGTSFNSLVVAQFSNYLKNAEKYLAEPEIVNISNLGNKINSPDKEYVPLLSSAEDLLIFTSRRMHNNNSLDPTGEPFEDVYYSTKEEGKMNWIEAKLLPGKVNTPKHDACVGLSPDGKKLFVFRTNDNLIGGDLYESSFKEGSWSAAIRMSDKINGYNSIEPSASISLDERTFYFSSNREGGYGGFDIYRVVKLPNNEWSEALNLGGSINTPFDDDSPFIHPDGKTLYFSSRGHESMGGFDIFRSTMQDEKWSKAENLGYPTNTTKDDIYFTISANEQHGYYSSAKDGGFGAQDIYQIDYLEKSLRQSVVKGLVRGINNEVLEAEITLLDPETADLVGVYISDYEDGGFIYLVNPNVEYEIIVEAEGYEEYSSFIEFSTEDLMEQQKMVFNLKPLLE